MVVFNRAIVTVAAATGSIRIATAPIITTVLARVFYKEKIKVIQYIAIVIEFIGVGVLTLMNGIFSINTGLLWLLLASISISFYNILQKNLTKKYSTIQTVVLSIWFGTIMLMVFLPVSINEIKTAPLMQIINLIVLGVFASAIGFITWTYAFSKASNASSVTNYMFLTPFVTTLLGMLFAKEIPDSSTIIGGSIIIAGMVIFYFSDNIIQKVRGINKKEESV
jgi:drug/metabolite transporter (DMT)-like permease